MGVLKCVDCGGDVSSSAPACPRCGRPADAGARFFARHRVVASVIRITLMLAAILLLLFGAVWCHVLRL